MKVIILAGGRGSRLGSHTDNIPKPMVTIGNRPIIWHIMKYFSYYGLNDFIICLGYKGDVIKNYFSQYDLINNDFTVNLSSGEIKNLSTHQEKDWKVTLVNTGIDTLKGARLYKVKDYLNSDNNIVTYGDGLADININNLLEFHNLHKKVLTVSGVRPPARFGEITEDNGKIISFEEKPQTSIGLINGGFMVFHKQLFNYLSNDINCDLEVGPLQALTSEGEAMVYKHSGSWECMDHERDGLRLNELWASNTAFWKVW